MTAKATRIVISTMIGAIDVGQHFAQDDVAAALAAGDRRLDVFLLAHRERDASG